MSLIDVIAKQRDDYGEFGLRMKRERDEARAWAKYYRAQFAAVMAEVEARNQAEYRAYIDRTTNAPFSPVMEED